ncbi:unnamed protein product [Cylicocyclus nassatus]|uniref:Uncharacterized protein n=1 Tax=Cylicocyclus nassatus TaxID=53992 RepID=A0AA36MAP7_CYLNA|nr:unnamed protein product [Cylicocyclus nassatus]
MPNYLYEKLILCALDTPITVLQPSRFAQFTHNRSPYAAQISNRRSSLNASMIPDTATPYFSLKGSRMLQGYNISPTTTPSENAARTISDAALLNDNQISRV